MKQSFTILRENQFPKFQLSKTSKLTFFLKTECLINEFKQENILYFK